ncbi:MAG: polysaccharide biosynthesis protein [Nannocystales bacterium]
MVGNANGSFVSRCRSARGELGWKHLLDGGVVLVGVFFAYFARFEAVPPPVYATQALLVLPLLAISRVFVLHYAGVYRRSWRDTDLGDAIQLSLFHGSISGALIVVRFAGPHLFADLTPVPLSVIGIEGLFALGGGAAVRSWTRRSHERGRSSIDAHVATKRALLVGAGREGCYTARGLEARTELGYSVVGFLDDERRRGEVVGGVEVLGSTRDLPDVAERLGIDLAVLTHGGPSARLVQDFIVQCKSAGISAHTIPPLPDLLSGRRSLSQIRPLDLAELLGRDEVDFSASSWRRVADVCKGRRVLVTGAGGSIGSELCRQLAALQPERIVLVDNNENNLFDIDNEIRRIGRDVGHACLADIRDRQDLRRVFEAHKPELVFHAAAFKHVPMMEFHPSAGVLNNVMGTRLLSEVARENGVQRLVMVSTDKAVRPTNVMGATKQVAEKIVQSSNAGEAMRACVVRFGNVLGSRGSVFHTFASQIDRGGPVTVTHPEITRFFMTIPEAVRLVIQAVSVAEGGEVFLLEMGEPVAIMDLAKQMIELSGGSAQDMPIVFTGLRPGEKLHEELVYEHEETVDCDVDGLLVARGEQVDEGAVRYAVAGLERAARQGDDLDVRDRLASFTDCPVISTRPQLREAR